VMESCGAALMAVLAKFTGGVPAQNGQSCMFDLLLRGDEPAEVSTLSHLLFQNCETIAKRRQQQLETFHKEEKGLAGADNEHGTSISASEARLTDILSSDWYPCEWIFPIESLLHTLCSIAGRPPTFDNDALQQCLELDVIRAIVIALSHLYFPKTKELGPDQYLIKRWVELMQSASEAAIKASGINQVYSYHTQMLLHSEGGAEAGAVAKEKTVSNLRAKLKKSISIYGTLYTYAREVFLAIGDCAEIIIPGGDCSINSPAAPPMERNGDNFLSTLYEFLPAQLSEVTIATTFSTKDARKKEEIENKSNSNICTLLRSRLNVLINNYNIE